MFLQIIILVFVFFALSRVFLRFYHKEITFLAFLFWVFIWFSITTVTLLPRWASFLASILGVGRGADLLVYLSIILLLYLVFRLYVRFENFERELTKLVRQLALREGKNQPTPSRRRFKAFSTERLRRPRKR